jgi:hypothetical protein
VDLIDGISDLVLSNLKDRGPKDGVRAISFGCPKRTVVEVFEFDDTTKERIFLYGYVPGNVSD